MISFHATDGWIFLFSTYFCFQFNPSRSFGCSKWQPEAVLGSHNHINPQLLLGNKVNQKKRIWRPLLDGDERSLLVKCFLFGWYVFSSRVLLLFLLWLMDGGVVQNLAPFIDLPRSVQHFQNVTTCYLFTTFKNVVHCRSVVLVCGLRAWSLEIPPRYDFSMTDHCSTCLPCRQVSFETSTLGVICIFS